MVRLLSVFLLFYITLGASEFDKNCFDCHGKDFKFHIIMKKYTLKYSSEKRIKEAMFDYLREPSPEKSILPLEYIQKFGLKEKSPLDDKTLREMIDIYYDRFNLQSKLF
ncbi:hypothetical protein M947_01370 [Sulfurimonas hongkongensis]|uniref:Cytochrome c domain-containing protein n=1 Tax=Sulfurimonas hongkongensis TaxID=1172190 RepID=T0JH96_9BACT|nr:hypothetical protein [Sulfurimonas hongkongensis]EQB40475.1 hypothetical protein M947_01370 [Sulfurimonas hongkongensis]